MMQRGIGDSAAGVESRCQELIAQRLARLEVHADHVLSWVLLMQWLLVVVLARLHENAAPLGLAWMGGAALSVVPIAGLLARRGGPLPRYGAAAAQILWALLLAQMGFDQSVQPLHGMLSLALLAMYRDRGLLWSGFAVACAAQAALAVERDKADAWQHALENAVWLCAATLVFAASAARGLRELQLWARCEATLDQTVEAAERQIAERTRESSMNAERFRRLVENISAVPWELDRATGKVVYLAPQFGDVFGVPQALASRPQFLELFHRDDREPFRRFLGETGAHRSHGEQFIDSRIMGADNGVVHVRSFVTDRGVGSDTPTVFGVTLDVTLQKRTEFERLQAQKLESIGQLSAGIAHEISTPTRYIGNNLRLLQQETQPLLAAQPQDDARVRAIERAIAQALEGIDRVANIVAAMQEFSHPALEKTPHDLNRAISSTIVVASNEWKYVAEVRTDLDATLPLVPVMPGAFNQVILNVLVNAAHAVALTLDGSADAKGSIVLSTRRIGDWAEIRISDSGCGIPEKIRERIFDPFFTTKPIGAGTGQGLAIAHDVIVKKHRGAIWAEPQTPAGTTFIIRLPIETRAQGTSAAA